MLLPTDYALIKDPEFRKWVEAYADDKELFYEHFSKAFAKLVELGVDRIHNPYEAAPKKSDQPGAQGAGDGEAQPLAQDNEERRKHNGTGGGCPVQHGKIPKAKL